MLENKETKTYKDTFGNYTQNFKELQVDTGI